MTDSLTGDHDPEPGEIRDPWHRGLEGSRWWGMVESLSRRGFLQSAAASSLGLAGAAWCLAGIEAGPVCCSGSDPIGCLRRHKFDVLSAFVCAQLHCLWGGPPGDSESAVADDVVKFAEHLDRPVQQGFCGLLSWVNLYAMRRTGRHFPQLSLAERTRLLNQGEYRPGAAGLAIARPLPLITWERDFCLHSAVGALSMVVRLVTHSRRPAREHVGMFWSEPCRQPERLVRVAPAPYPDLAQEFDVCIVGSGAGGGVVAARAAEAGLRVLIVEMGDWVSPDALVERYDDGQGGVHTAPARCDTMVTRLYQKAGVHIAGGLGEVIDNGIDVMLPWRRKRMEPLQSINVLQAGVVGGGPYINNAIHLEIREDAWNRWGDRRPAGIDYQSLWDRMQQVNRELGVNRLATQQCAGNRSWMFAEGGASAGEEVEPLPVAIQGDCQGCGADNSVDPFGSHTGGLHPYRPAGPNSYLMRALHAAVPAQIAYRMRALNFEFESAPGAVRAGRLIVEDLRGLPPGCPGPRRVVKARQFVLAAGSYASTQVLRASVCRSGLCLSELGERLTSNVGTPVYAVFDKPIAQRGSEQPEPGITQCFFVDRKLTARGEQVIEPALENWFHFPGTVAVALTGWFKEYADVMNKYNHIAMAGMVVPTKVRRQNRINGEGKIHLELDQEEFELLLAGIQRIGEIFLAAATAENGVSIGLPTKGLLLDPAGKPIVIRSTGELRSAVDRVRCRGPAFLNLLTSHLQGGNSLGSIVSRSTFRVQLADGREAENLYVADASIFPAGAEINPQLTIKALAMYAADSLLERS